MADIRIVPFSIGDLMGSTHSMTCAEFGAYMRLLIWHYQLGEGGIPGDDSSLARNCHLNGAAWARIKTVVVDKFQRDPQTSKLYHRRVICELKRIAQVSSQARDKALKRHHPEDAAALQGHSRGNATLNTEPEHLPLTPKKGVEGGGVIQKETPKPPLSNSDPPGPPPNPAPYRPTGQHATLTEFFQATGHQAIPPEWLQIARISAKQAGVDPDDVPRQAERFVAHYRDGKGKAFTQVEWSGEFLRWVRDANKNRGERST